MHMIVRHGKMLTKTFNVTSGSLEAHLFKVFVYLYILDCEQHHVVVEPHHDVAIAYGMIGFNELP